LDINSLKDNLSKSLAEVSTKGIPSATFEPVWINNITRLNAQNFNSRMYPTIASYITGYGNAVFDGSNEQLSNLLTILPGYKVTDSNTTEIHNIELDLSSTNKAKGIYQAVFGKGNESDISVEGQFILGKYNKTGNDFIFAIGNGESDTVRSNALEVSLDGTIKTSNINVLNGITTPYVSLTQIITDTSDDKYATTKKYVFDKVKTEQDRATTAEQLLTTNLNNEISRAKAEEDTIRAIASSAFHFKGTKPSVNDLPKTGNTQGDVWQVGDKEYAWNGSEWVELGFNVDLTPYIKTVDAEAKISAAKTEAITSANSYTDTAVSSKQNTLVSGSNIKALKDDVTSAQSLLGSGNINFKTINGTSLFGTGNITIEGGGGTVTVDDSLSSTSINPVQNKVINAALENKQDAYEYDSGYWYTTFDKGPNLEFRNPNGTGGLMTLYCGNLFVNGKSSEDLVEFTSNVDITIADYKGVFTVGSQDKSTIEGLNFKTVTPGGTVQNATFVNVPKIVAPDSSNLTIDAKQDLSVSTTNYSMSWDSTSQAIKIAFN